ncbi:uncharacterized protein LOC103313442 [Tribolium castaneum]|uniref:uncharacterized protein LOC103313442 n=1 Tax=Tribolium castaneum TaxID=7070 RepID=UPI00077DD48E|nr:PREDICTED: uncharacterized protein LOC103313442 [Tribolium castaneum]|eukprot:XP_008194948.2 PREDICTED: uncharacterized protein LOC103313442 [Tribolium castaneum]
MSFLTTPTILLSLFPALALTLICYSCQNGYEAETPCSDLLPIGMWERCDKPNSQCVQAIEWFQNGALRLAVRQCWTPSANNTKNFCQSYRNKQGKLKFCEVCTSDLCNNKNLYKPLKTCGSNSSTRRNNYKPNH